MYILFKVSQVSKGLKGIGKRSQTLDILRNPNGTIADFEQLGLGLPEPNYLFAKNDILSKRLSFTKIVFVSVSLQTSPAPH